MGARCHAAFVCVNLGPETCANHSSVPKSLLVAKRQNGGGVVSAFGPHL